MKEHNQRYERGEVSYTKTINQYSDMSKDEFNARYHAKGLRNIPELDLTKAEESRPRVGASYLPEHVDWYAAGKVSESVD